MMAKKALLLIDWVGCSRNILLKLRIEDYLKANRWLIASPEEIQQCDLVIFCSCGVTSFTQKRSLHIISAVNQRGPFLAPKRNFVVAGCLPAIRPAAIANIHNGSVLGPHQLIKLDTIINATVPIAQIPHRNKILLSDRKQCIIPLRKFTLHVKIINCLISLIDYIKQTFTSKIGRLSPALLSNPALDRFYQMDLFDYYQTNNKTWSVLISQGCHGQCSYCSIKIAKGTTRSRPVLNITKDIEKGIASGYSFISLIADDTGSYGKDINTTLSSLLNQVKKIPGIWKLILESLSPDSFISAFNTIRDITRSNKLQGICFTLQHVNPGILSSMHRAYDLATFKRCLLSLCEDNPQLVITSHCIIGYPGETDTIFEELASFIQWFLRLSPYTSIKHFAFSANPATEAASMNNQIPRHIIKKRMRLLARVISRHKRQIQRKKLPLHVHPIQNIAVNGLWLLSAFKRMIIRLNWKIFSQKK